MFLYSLGSHEDASWSAMGCYLYDLLCITVPQMFHTASNWLTLGTFKNNDKLLFISVLLFCTYGTFGTFYIDNLRIK